MKRFRQWIPIVCIPVSLSLAQSPATEVTRVDLARAAVTVVFAPDYSSAPRPNLRSVDTPPSRILSAMTGGRVDVEAGTHEFSAPKGMTGIKTGVESVMTATVTVGDDEKLKFDCSALPEALERLKSANRRAAGTEKAGASDR